MKIWIISDTHFFHHSMVRFENRPTDHTDVIIKNWNDLVGWDDIVIHLGDVIFGMNKDETLPKIMRRLAGKKWLAKGNHDTFAPEFYLARGFDFVCDYFVVNGIAFSHAPLTPLPSGVTLNIHGHFHRGHHRDSGTEVDATKNNRYYDYAYFNVNRDKYHLIQIEDDLSPRLLNSITGTFTQKRKW